MSVQRDGDSGRDFLAVQRAFAAHLRDPAVNPPPPGLDDRRLGVYRDLVFNNVERFLAGFFPVTRSLHDDVAWQALVRGFLARHRAQSPYFLDMAEEFLAWLGGDRAPVPGEPPFLRELAHYEWLELAVDVDDATWPAEGIDPAGDLLAGVPVPSPLAVLATYAWPVHRLGPAFRPARPPAAPTCLVVYRDRADRVRFLEAGPATARLWALMHARPGATGHELALAAAGDAPERDPGALLAGAREVLSVLRARDIVLGTRLR